MLNRILTLFAAVALLFEPSVVAAQGEDAALRLPSMELCTAKSHPIFPEKWHGTYLMAPFAKAQLVLGDFTYDASLYAMRARLFGLRRGSLDLLITEKSTFLLGQNGDGSDGCVDLGDTGLRPLPRDLLAKGATCAGSAPLNAIETDWWKTPSNAVPSGDWIWYKKADASPFRLMFTQPARDRAVLGWFTFSYQTRFERLPTTNLADIASVCRSKARPGGNRHTEVKTMIAEMERSPSKDEAELARLMPELDSSCTSAPAAGWSEHAAMTAFMTSPNFGINPVPTEVLYDWSRKSQRTRMISPLRSRSKTEDALLRGAEGFSVVRNRDGGLSCEGSLPGTLRPNWPETGGCSCEAVIKGKTALTPFGSAQVLLCPMTKPRVVWSWFAHDGRPMVFMETSAPDDPPSLGILTLADYYSWSPGHSSAGAAFEVPSQCPPRKPAEMALQEPKHALQSGSRSCGACHLDTAR